MAKPGRNATESGVMVYPRLPLPAAGAGDDRRGEPPRRRRGRALLLLAGFTIAALGGAIGGAFVGPMIVPDPEIAALSGQVVAANQASAAAEARAAQLSRDLAAAVAKQQATTTRLATAEQAEAQLAATAATAATAARERAALQTQLTAAAKGVGTVTADDTELRIVIPAGALFRGSDSELSDRGRAALARLAPALKELSQQRIFVHGHTDSTPPPLPRSSATRPPAAGKPPGKGKRAPAPPPAPAAVAAPITNWELAASRALAVVHLLQDVHKLDPSRLAAASYGQYRPLGRRSDLPANRRIELVIR